MVLVGIWVREVRKIRVTRKGANLDNLQDVYSKFLMVKQMLNLLNKLLMRSGLMFNKIVA